MNDGLSSFIAALSREEREHLLATLTGTGDGPATEPAVPSGHPAPAPAPAPGRKRFPVLDRVGAGGMGCVYRVHDRLLLRESAMKVLAPELATQPKYVGRFLGEVQIQAQLEHPGIVPVHEVTLDDPGGCYFVMRLVSGTSMGAWIRRMTTAGTFSEKSQELLSAFVKVCDTLAYAHSRGVVHGDVTSENIVVGPFGAVYLMDWGLARLVRSGAGSVTISAAAKNAVSDGEMAGTPAFMAPEQASGHPDLIDERTDVFGLGAVLHLILTGQSPNAGRSVEEVVQRSRAGLSPVSRPLALTNPDGLPVPSGLCGVVARALAADPNERHQGVLELKRDVERFLRGGLAWPLRRLAAGTCIVSEGEPGEAAFVVVQGTCVVYKQVRGERRELRRLEPGGVFGEAAIFSPGPRTASVDAVTDVVLGVVTREIIEAGLGLDSALGVFVTALGERFRDLDARSTAGDAARDR